MQIKHLVKIILFALFLPCLLIGCNQSDGNEQTASPSPEPTPKPPQATPATSSPEPEQKEKVENNNDNPKVQIEMENGGKIVLELYPKYAPETVGNFLDLVNSGFYDGLTFHRIVDGFMAQGGDPKGNGTGGNDKKIKGEFAETVFAQKTLKHTKGVISMARSGDPNSASSQFFVMFKDQPFLDGKYAAFGKVITGMEVVEDFQKVERTVNSMGEIAIPVKPVVMKKMTVLK